MTATADLVPVDNAAVIESLDPQAREMAVTRMLTEARAWLAHAVEATQPQEIATFKAQMATMAEATRQLGLSREIQLDAQEMVRRAERGVGQAIRKGQAEGTVRRQGQGNELPVINRKFSPYEFATSDELTANGAGIYHLTDGVTDEAFDAAIGEARDEGNLSRANVVRKVHAQRAPGQSRTETAEAVRDLAARGMSSEQIAEEVGRTTHTVKGIARDYAIEIGADRVLHKTRRPQATRVVRNTVEMLESLADGLKYADLADVEVDADWATSLTESLRVLNRFARQIKEMTQ